MADSILICFLFHLFIHRVCLAQIASILPRSFVLPVIRDGSTLQYITEISYGTPSEPTKLVVDLNGASIWIDCGTRLVSSSSLLHIQDPSIQCLKAKPHVKWQTSCLFGPTQPSQKHRMCQVSLQNVNGTKSLEGKLVQDMVALQSADISNMGASTKVHHFLISCAPSLLLNGLASGAKGMLGLGRSQISFASQLATQRKFTLCLSSSTGVIFFNSMPLDPIFRDEIMKELTYTPLINSPSHESTFQAYSINVKSIKINGHRVSLNSSLLSKDKDGTGGTVLSSRVPYTTMESSLFATFTQAYIKAAKPMNMITVAPVKPFGLCFGSKGIESTALGPNVPDIDLVLQSEMVKWRIHGRNSMVKVSDRVMCLGFLDGGSKPSNAIVIGGHQLEDILVHVDLSTSMLGFSPSLLTRGTACSNFSSVLRLF